MFVEGAQMVLDFAFEQIGVHRVEARCAVHNGRATARCRSSAPSTR